MYMPKVIELNLDVPLIAHNTCAWLMKETPSIKEKIMDANFAICRFEMLISLNPTVNFWSSSKMNCFSLYGQQPHRWDLPDQISIMIYTACKLAVYLLVEFWTAPTYLLGDLNNWRRLILQLMEREEQLFPILWSIYLPKDGSWFTHKCEIHQFFYCCSLQFWT